MFQYLFLTSVHKRNAKNLMEVSEIPEFSRRIFRMMSSDSPPKPILSAISFPITLSLDQTVYLSYYSRYSRFCYFDHFFAHISGSTGSILLTSKTILSATKFPIMLVNIIFSVSVIFLEIFSKNNDASFKTE